MSFCTSFDISRQTYLERLNSLILDRLNSLIKAVLFLPFQSAHLSFTFLGAPARTSNKVFTKRDQRGHVDLVLDVWGKAFSLSPLNMTLAVACSSTTFSFCHCLSYSVI